MGASPLLLLLLLLCAAVAAYAHPLPPPISIPDQDLAALEAFRSGIFEDPSSVLADWTLADRNPCDWTGVECADSRDHVIAINLTGYSLKGFIAQEIGELSSLQKLILSNNLFYGVIPRQIRALTNLQVLDLSNNRLSGPIPPEIGDLRSVSKINFHFNGLTGGLPPEFGKLTTLKELRLDRNRLKGPIPGTHAGSIPPTDASKTGPTRNATGLCLLPQLTVGDFSYNFFIGSIPQCLLYLPKSSFQGNCLHDKSSVLQRSSQQCGTSGTSVTSEMSNLPTSNPKAEPKHQGFKQPQWLLILEVATGAAFVLFLAVAMLATAKRCGKVPSMVIWKGNSNSTEQMIISIDDEMLKHVTRLDRQELEAACEDFSNIIGSSADSIVYKGTLKDGQEVAVISLSISQDHWNNDLELYFQTEVANLARLNHGNAAKLLGYCKERDPFSRMLIFEYASNGTLYEHLHYGEECQLSWSRRMKIIIGIARGLRYLHTELQPPICLSELHSSAVYLTEDFSPKLVDFECWTAVFSKSEKNSGYIINGNAFHGLQDLLQRRHIDLHGNIFAFGVLLLEIVSGRPPYCKERGFLVDWASEYLDKPDMMCHLVDPELRYFNHDDLRIVCNIVSLCIQPEPSKRPLMESLAATLEDGIDISAAANLKETHLSWAESALSS